MSDNPKSSASRRDFLKTATATAGAAVVTNLTLAPTVHAAGSDQIKVGIVGCGGRGSGAAENVLSAAKGVTIHALGDVFKFKADGLSRHLTNFAKGDRNKNQNSVDVEGRVFSGLDAYKQVIDSGANYIILATTPGFRPIHLEAAIAAGKNIFTEKPVGVDGPGIRKVLAAAEEATRKGLHIVAGTQRRHQLAYVETMKRIHDGAIGDIVGGRGFWMQGLLWQRVDEMKKHHPEIKGDVAQQIYNWYNHTWLCGDHIVEQHVHNLDVLNWAIKTHPVSARGMGFSTRTDPKFGHIYDFFAIDYKYPNDVHTLSMCRQISNCASEVGEHLVGTKGTCHTADRSVYHINGKDVFTRKEFRTHRDPYVQEHMDLIESIRSGKPLNELKRVAESTLTAIMGRMSAYTGKEVSWEQALNSKEDTMPKDLTLEMSKPESPLAIPGKTPLV